MLALRGHDRLGHRAPAVYPWPLPGSRPGRRRRDGTPAAAGLRDRLRGSRWCGTAPCSAISRAGTSWPSFMRRFLGRRPAASSARAASRSSCAGAARHAPQRRHSGRLLLVVAASIVVQMQPNHLNHLSRWGHWAAGHWLAEHADPTELVLDTRGWADLFRVIPVTTTGTCARR